MGRKGLSVASVLPAAAAVVEAAPVTLQGARRVLHEPPVFGAQLFSSSAISTWSQVQALQIGTSNQWVRWRNTEPTQNQFEWLAHDAYLDAFAKALPTLDLRVVNEYSPLTLPPTGYEQYAPSAPPANDADYVDWLTRLVARSKYIVRRYCIDNECLAYTVWPFTPEQYWAMLALARAVIKTGHGGNPPLQSDALILDAGLSSSGIALAYANELAQAGRGDEAATFLNGYWQNHSPRAKRYYFADGAAVQAFLLTEDIPQLLAFVQTYWNAANLALFDALQIHLYTGWEHYATVLAWLRGKLTAAGHPNKPIEILELGYGWQWFDQYSEVAHAWAMPKLLVSSLMEGVCRVIYWRGEDVEGRRVPGLIESDGRINLAGWAFRTTALLMRSAVAVTKLGLGAGVHAARVERADGSICYAAWSSEGPKTVRLPVGRAARWRVLNPLGDEVAGQRPQALRIGDMPLFVEVPDRGSYVTVR